VTVDRKMAAELADRLQHVALNLEAPYSARYPAADASAFLRAIAAGQDTPADRWVALTDDDRKRALESMPLSPQLNAPAPKQYNILQGSRAVVHTEDGIVELTMPSAPAGEREAFEEAFIGVNLRRDKHGFYADKMTQCWWEGWRCKADQARAALAPDGDKKKLEAAALPHFVEYFVRNYPGPHTIISNPNWHAPKIFRAAMYALDAARAALGNPAANRQEDWHA
jgi:hypothetical protein